MVSTMYVSNWYFQLALIFPAITQQISGIFEQFQVFADQQRLGFVTIARLWDNSILALQ